MQLTVGGERGENIKRYFNFLFIHLRCRYDLSLIKRVIIFFKFVLIMMKNEAF